MKITVEISDDLYRRAKDVVSLGPTKWLQSTLARIEGLPSSMGSSDAARVMPRAGETQARDVRVAAANGPLRSGLMFPR
jgi:hypothetical protein